MPAAFSLTGSPWLDTALAAAVAVVAVLIAHAVAAALLARLTRSHRGLAIMQARAHAPARWILVFLALELVWEAAPAGLAHLGTVQHATALALIGCVTWLALRAAGALVEIVLELNPSDVSDNLEARRLGTQARVLGRTLGTFVWILGISAALITFPGVRQIGATLLASASVAGLVAGFAARPVLGNLIAGLQIALTQPLRLDDVLIVEGEWGRVEEIASAYVVIRIWDERRLIVPLQWFIEHPFQNWTRTSAQIMGTVFLWVDYGLPLEPLKAELARLLSSAPEWDGRVSAVQVTDLTERSMQVRILVSSTDSGRNFELRCRVREGLVAFIRREYPQFLPRLRAEAQVANGRDADDGGDAQAGAPAGTRNDG